MILTGALCNSMIVAVSQHWGDRLLRDSEGRSNSDAHCKTVQMGKGRRFLIS